VGNMQPPNVKVLSHSSPYGGQRGVLANVFALLLAACVLLLLSGCRNLLSDSEGSETEAGILLLIIHGQSVGRTIRPDIDIDDFDRFDLGFVDVSGDNADFNELDWDGGPISLGVGTWDLHVTAFLRDGTEYLEAARGSIEDYIVVLPGGTVGGNIELSPIIEGGEGTFSWHISFFPEITVTSARMEIRYGTLSGDIINNGIINFVIDGTSLSGSRSMLAGQYFVIFEMLDDDGERVGINEALHIFHNMESRVEWDFTPYDFPVSLLDWVLGSWDDDNEQWNFAARGIAAGHFSMLGIQGIDDDNFHSTDNTGIIYWFNRLIYAEPYIPAVSPLPPAVPPYSMARLGELVDAALIGIGSGSIAAGVYSNREAAAHAIFGLVRNSNTLFTRWHENPERIEVRVGLYHVPLIAITIQPPPPQPPPNSPLADQLEWLRNHAAPGSSHTITINYAYITSIAAQLPTTAGVTITLCGGAAPPQYVSLPENGTGSLFTIGYGVTLVLDNVELRAWSANTDVLVRVRSGGTLIMNGGAISSNSGQYGFDGGGGVLVETGGRFDMHGGTISTNTTFSSNGNDNGNKVAISGGVTNWGIFNMHGGRIEMNSSPSFGGGVYVGDGGVFNMHGGQITGNRSFSNGGGVYVHDYGTFRMENGTIYGNEQEWTFGGNSADTGAALSNSGTAQRGTFTDGVFTPIDDLPSTNNTITVSNGNLIAGP